MSYRIEFTPSARRDMRKLPRHIVPRVDERILSLAENPRPHNVEKLTGQNRYRVRVGNYRVVYHIHDDVLVVLVVAIGDRKEVYRRL